MRTTYSYSDFSKSYPDIAKEVEDGMYNGVMHYLYWLDKLDIVPTQVVSSVDLVAVEWKPQNVKTLTLTLCVYLANEMFFVDSVDIQYGDITNPMLNNFVKNQNLNYPIEFFEESRQEDLPSIIEERLKFNASLLPNNVICHTLLTYTKNTQYFHDVYGFNEENIRNVDYASLLEYDPKYDRD